MQPFWKVWFLNGWYTTFKNRTIRKPNFKKFNFRMDSEFKCSVFEPPLYSDVLIWKWSKMVISSIPGLVHELGNILVVILGLAFVIEMLNCRKGIPASHCCWFLTRVHTADRNRAWKIRQDKARAWETEIRIPSSAWFDVWALAKIQVLTFYLRLIATHGKPFFFQLLLLIIFQILMLLIIFQILLLVVHSHCETRIHLDWIPGRNVGWAAKKGICWLM